MGWDTCYGDGGWSDNDAWGAAEDVEELSVNHRIERQRRRIMDAKETTTEITDERLRELEEGLMERRQTHLGQPVVSFWMHPDEFEALIAAYREREAIRRLVIGEDGELAWSIRDVLKEPQP